MTTSLAGTAPESAPVRSRPSRLDWFAALLPIGLWIAHLSIDAALTRFTCTEPSARWSLHAATVVTALATAACIVWSVRGARRSAAAAEDAGSDTGQTRFVALLGIGIGAFNLILILWEGSYVLFLRSCG